MSWSDKDDNVVVCFNMKYVHTCHHVCPAQFYLQNGIIEWARDHRTHHKFAETDADPHNAKRGFFFAHMGWLLVRKHPDVKIKGKGVDMSDLLSDPLCSFQQR